jgi:hypothetical protein
MGFTGALLTTVAGVDMTPFSDIPKLVLKL